jgi:hypothetical protein
MARDSNDGFEVIAGVPIDDLGWFKTLYPTIDDGLTGNKLPLS